MSRTLAGEFSRRRPAPGEVRRHPRRSDDMIFVAPSSAGLWNVRKNEITFQKSFADYGDAGFGHHKGKPSDDGMRMPLGKLRRRLAEAKR